MAEPWLTVIVPIYNAAVYLPACLDSITQAQPQDGNVHTVLVNDASTDPSPAIAQRWVAEDPATRRLVHHATNRGLAASRNTGWAASTTPWLLWLDSDDVLSVDTVSLLSAAIAADPATDLWIVPCARIDDAGHHIGPFYQGELPWNPIAMMQAHPAQILLGNLFGAFAATRRSILPASPWDEQLRILEDWDLWIRLLFLHHARVGMLPRETGGYRRRADSLSTTFREDNPDYHAAWITVYAKILRDLPQLPPDVRRAVGQQLAQRGQQWVTATVAQSAVPSPTRSHQPENTG